MKNRHCMSGLGQGYATRFVYRLSACPGAAGCGYAMVSLAYGCLTFHSLILTCQVWARVALYFDDTRLTNPDTSGATVYRKPSVKNILKNLEEPFVSGLVQRARFSMLE